LLELKLCLFSSYLKIRERTEKFYPQNTKAILFTKLMEPYKGVYETHFSKAMSLLNQNPKNLIPLEAWQKLLCFSKEHIGFRDSNNKEILDFTKRLIASYGAEGIIFDYLSKTIDYSNCIWLNFEETEKNDYHYQLP
jgi:hypothetical protein